MGEAYIVRRAGGSGTSSGSQVFLQSTEPPYENGGLWVNTELEKYATLTEIETGARMLSALTKQLPNPGGVGFKTICGDWIYAVAWRRGSDDYGYIVGLNINTLQTVQSNRFYIENNEWIQTMYLVSDGGDNVVCLTGGSSSGDDRQWHIYHPSTNSFTTTGNVISFEWGAWYSCDTKPNDIFIYYAYSESTDTNTWGRASISTQTLSAYGNTPIEREDKSRVCGFDGDTFFIYYNGTSGRMPLYSVEAQSGTKTQIVSGISAKGVYVYGRYGANLYGTSSNDSRVFSINIEASVKTYLFTDANSLDNFGSSQPLYNNCFYVSNPTVVYPIEMVGDYDPDTVYIQVSGTENMATIARDDKGNFNVPIERVVTFPEGSPVDATAYVSTGEAWTQI